MTHLLQDVRYGFRLLRNSPGFSIAALLMLALGIGGNTAIFSLVDAVALRSLPVRDPSQLVVLRWAANKPPHAHGFSSFGDCDRSTGNDASGCSLPLPLFNRMQSETKIFSNVTAFAGPNQFALGGNGPAQMIEGELVSGDYFRTLGVTAAFGRTLQPDDDDVSASPAAVLSYAFWQKAFGGEPSAIGRTIRLNGKPFTIVGVAERSFTNLSPGKTQDLYLPIAMMSRLDIPWARDMRSMDEWWLVVLARLKPGVSLSQAQAAANLVFRNELLHGSTPLFKESENPGLSLRPAQEGLTGRRGFFSKILNVLMCAVGFVLLIVCANVAGLLLSRAAARQKEIALRLAIGAGPKRIFRQLITEGLTLSLLGGLIGILFSYWGVKGVTALLSTRSAFPFVVSPDWRVLSFTLSVAVLTGVLFALAPAIQSTRTDLMLALKQVMSGTSGSSPARRFHVASAVVVAQVSLSIVVLLAAGLLMRTLQNLHNIDPGFDTRNVLLFEIDPSLSGYKDQQMPALYRHIKERLAAIPGVTAVSYSSDALLSGGLWTSDMYIEGESQTHTQEIDMLAIGPDFLNTLRIPLLQGRGFTSDDFEHAAQAALSESKAPVSNVPIVPIAVNAAFAHRYFPNQNPLGKRLTQRETEASNSRITRNWEIVAVVGNTKYDELRREIHPGAYVPLATARGASFEIRTALAPATLTAPVRETMKRVDSNLPLTRLRTQTESIEGLLTQERVTAQLASFFGILALALTCFGTYGLLSYEVSRRTREIGIRMALGAERGIVLRHILSRAATVILIGLVIGIAGGLAVTRLLSSLLFGVTASDPLTFLSVSLLLTAVSLLACYIPAHRATKLDPIASLRYE